MRSSKSRSRSKSNRQRSVGNIINRVFDSSGPEGKVRGTPQQIIDKYLALARDAQLGNDRVAEQNFLQHAEHYTRLLGEAQREQAREQEARQAEQQARHEQRQAEQQARQEQREQQRAREGDQPETGQSEDLVVDTPEAAADNGRSRNRRRSPRSDQNSPRSEQSNPRSEQSGVPGEASADAAELPAFVSGEPSPAKAPRARRSRKVEETSPAPAQLDLPSDAPQAE